MVSRLRNGKPRTYCNKRCANAWHNPRRTADLTHAEIERAFAAAKAAIEVRRRNNAGA
jgi:hypothetical protein